MRPFSVLRPRSGSSASSAARGLHKMIEAIVGLPGSGKTLWAVHRLLQAKKRGRHALANFLSRTGSWDFGLWADIAEAGNCLAVIDEAHMWFSARTWTKTNQLELSYFQQHRKEGVDL